MKRWHWVLIAILLFSFVILGIENFGAFMAEHSYYQNMLSNNRNWGMIAKGIVFSAIPVLYLVIAKNPKRKGVYRTLLVSVFLFGLSHIGLKAELLGSGGTIMFAINTVMILSLMVYFSVAIMGVGIRLNKLTTKFNEKTPTEAILIWGLGLGVFLLTTHFLIIANLLYPVVTRLMFVTGGVLAYRQRASLQEYGDVLMNATKKTMNKKSFQTMGAVAVVLLIVTILYFNFGFQLSFIPYPTAWDANHAYMLYPKIRAGNNGFFRSEGPVTSLYLWSSYITYRFSLRKPLEGFMWISADTIAIMMNFLSGVFVMIFGLAMFREIRKRFDNNQDEDGKDEDDSSVIGSQLFQYFGWFFLLLWLTSGMGAFLVFVDNKTDLGVMSLVVLAMLSGFVFINHLHKTATQNKSIYPYLISSGLFFTMAIMSKPSALIDFATFLGLLVGLLIGAVALIGFFLVLIGVMAKLELQGIVLFVQKKERTTFLLGLPLLVPEAAYKIRKKSLKGLKYVTIRAVVVLGGLVLLKTPQVMSNAILIQEDTSLENLFRQYLMGYEHEEPKQLDHKLLMVTNSPSMAERTQEDIPFNTCSADLYTEESLTENIREIDRTENQGGADRGRYIGFGQRTFTDPSQWSDDEKQSYGFVRLGYPLLRLIYPKDNVCYATDPLAKELCEERENISARDPMLLNTIAESIENDDKERSERLVDLVQDVQNGTRFESDVIQIIESYRTTRAVLTAENSIKVPYKYLIPFNIVYNRSLQNLSSYYTDIGFIRLFTYIIIIVGLIYGLITLNRKLLTIVLATIGGFTVRYLVGYGILWYGMGVIVRMIIASVLVLYQLYKDMRQYKYGHIVVPILFFPLVLWGLVQLVFNVTRITSQGAGGPFVYYKQMVGRDTTVKAINNRISTQQELVRPYTWESVFDRQFGHYDPLIELTSDRNDEDGVRIAGTYAQYFLENQNNITYDGMVGNLRKKMSDGDVCASYVRLKDANKKYIALDPNIATVVMGQGNSYLFDRFFYKRDASGQRIDDGVIAMMARLVMNGYAELHHTNNLGIKYAFGLDGESIQNIMAQVGEEDEVVMRTQLAGLRFFRERAGQLGGVVSSIFTERMTNGQAVQDVADLYGKIIDATKVFTTVQQQSTQNPEFMNSFEELTEDEKFVFLQYANLLTLYRTDQQRFQQEVARIVQRSIGGGSQIMVFELNDK